MIWIERYYILYLLFLPPTRALKNKCYFAIKHIFSFERLHFQKAVSIITLKWSEKEQSGAKTHILIRGGGEWRWQNFRLTPP